VNSIIDDEVYTAIHHLIVPHFLFTAALSPAFIAGKTTDPVATSAASTKIRWLERNKT